MNKSELIDAIAKAAEITKSKAQIALDCFVSCIKTSLKKGSAVTLVGFGTFDVRDKSARMGRNPQTGQPIKIAARKVAVFKPGKNLKDEINASKGGKTEKK